MSATRIFDVCGTLVLDDTTIGLMRWHFRRLGLKRRWILAMAAHRFSPVRYAFSAVERVTKSHVLKHVLLALLYREEMNDLNRSAAEYADWLLENRRISEVQEILEGLPAGGRIILASASLEPIVAALATRLSASYVASELEAAGGRCLGRLKHDLAGRKIDALDEKLGLGWRICPYLAVSDNLSDRSLLAGAERAYVVLHSERHRKRWRELEAEYISI
ncbi:haloacid dehalogenase-like hydrolase [Arenimonas caeni]|uniref:HAD-IB family hydrolase n=1 Tax=Arenimonas caeni TaxID=2058085 RepID=A0A2P6MBN6_9GAMM|nr:haloacid dehalogenase-like hydrolase [Arenimonas caeni]PRH83405.1 hypothetical protein C6N40_01785 [Arenimonas caeni]